MSFQAIAQAIKINLKTTDKITLIMLANYADEDFNCFPSQKLLAENCGCSVKTIYLALQRLEDAGVISTERRTRGNGSLTSNFYHLHIGDDKVCLPQDVDEQPVKMTDSINNQSVTVTGGNRSLLPDLNLSTLTGKNNKKKIIKRKNQISDEWRMNKKAREIGEGEGYTWEEDNFIQREFINYCKANAKTYADFDRAFYNWLRSGITHQTINRRRENTSRNIERKTLNQIAG